MSDPRVERGPDEQAQEQANESLLGPHVRATGRKSPRARTEVSPELETLLRGELGVGSAGGATTASEAETVSSSSVRGSPSGVRARPHGVRVVDAPLPHHTPHPRSARAAAERLGGVVERRELHLPAFRLPELHRPELHRPQLHRPSWPLSLRQTIAVAFALTLVVAVVSAMFVVIPNKPVATPGTGSVRDIAFRDDATPPQVNFDYGPYFVDQGSRLLMIGTDAVVSNGSSSTTTTVWATTDGSSWQTISAAGSFVAGDRRFVVQGFAQEGSGNLVAVGNASGADSKVEAEAWHSRDGVTWSQASVDFAGNVQMVGLAARPDALVSAGNGVAWFSRDGTSWNVTPLPDATGYLPRVVRAWAGGFEILAISNGTDAPHTASWASADGRTWTRTANLAGFQVQDLVAYGNGLVAVGSQRLTAQELATPTPTPTPKPSGSVKTTPKPTPTPKKSAAASGSAAAASPSPTAPPAPAVEIATSWISPDGSNWYRGTAIDGRGSLALESIAQVYDSLVAVASEPGAMPGVAGAATASPTATIPDATPTPAKHASLWISDDGLNWSPLATEASPLSRGRLTPFGHSVVLSGFDQSGSFAVMLGDVTLGSPLPVVAATATPPFTIALKIGTTPMVPGVTADSTLGPLLASHGRFMVFVDNDAGASVYTSPDGQVWTPDADPKELTPASATGVPAIFDAIDDGEGGVVAVGSFTGDSPAPAAWQLSGTTWTAGTITVDGTAPTSLGSVTTRKGVFVAAANSDGGARILYSNDGQAWQAASISGADGYKLTVSTWVNGFIAAGSNSSGKSAVWTSQNGQFWISEASWKVPANLVGIYGFRTGLVATSASVASGTSWWWSTDGRSWNDSQLTAVGGCWGTLDSGLAVVSTKVPGAGPTPIPTPTPTPTPKPKPTAKPTGSIAPTPSPTIAFKGGWSISASGDGHAWQRAATGKFGFDGADTCRIASTQGKVVVIGWANDGIPRAFFGSLSGL